MITINCPKCGADSRLSLIQSSYHGPHKCWKCRALYTIKIEHNQVISLEPLSQEELDKQRQIEELKSKFGRQQFPND
ncbi:MAG: hypothetical protein A2144_07840 [Chloroflexi bacterium RBG_16_50_9]|nr:MAG: hypothetical protein A2144_07840 [Chloroflexi bacterium RBG_16_50_9]